MIRASAYQTRSQDTFDPNLTDASETKALENAIWELKTLRKYPLITIVYNNFKPSL